MNCREIPWEKLPGHVARSERNTISAHLLICRPCRERLLVLLAIRRLAAQDLPDLQTAKGELDPAALRHCQGHTVPLTRRVSRLAAWILATALLLFLAGDPGISGIP